jgi:hypothetical protein
VADRREVEPEADVVFRRRLVVRDLVEAQQRLGHALARSVHGCRKLRIEAGREIGGEDEPEELLRAHPHPPASHRVRHESVERLRRECVRERDDITREVRRRRLARRER